MPGVDVGAASEEHRDGLRISSGDGCVQGLDVHRIARGNPDLRAAIEQVFHGVHLTEERGKPKGHIAVGTEGVGERSVAIQQPVESVDLAERRRLPDRELLY